MQPEQTHPRPRGFRRRLLGDIFHGVKRYLILGVAATLCATFLTYVTPLVVSFTVDSVIGDKTPELPRRSVRSVPAHGRRAYFSGPHLVLASLVVLVTLLGGVFTYLRGHCIAFAGEGLAKAACATGCSRIWRPCHTAIMWACRRVTLSSAAPATWRRFVALCRCRPWRWCAPW